MSIPRHLKAIRPRNSGDGDGIMFTSQTYRDNAAQCLSAAAATRDPYYHKLQLSIAATWILLARQGETTATMLAGWRAVEPVTTEVLAASLADAAGAGQGNCDEQVLCRPC
jgi:hypothetical protein